MRKSGLRLNVDCRTNEPVSLFQISVIVTARIIHIYILPLFSRWYEVVLPKG
jgi:hypothetical protein